MTAGSWYIVGVIFGSPAKRGEKMADRKYHSRYAAMIPIKSYENPRFGGELGLDKSTKLC